ncbi:VIT1/CCC1 transporter family protein [Wenzhouxiangella marina]|uniref:Fe(2+)/Mn(2+) transporter pcl1 n=1 Tax=Wenzhouxiangella marina TaxID=1579979 RepID=A0A0K0XTW4_9GAMM|nr:VIT family protein [Wenzhouxiangella marina]AKS41123.1 Fe(2+)/Mn(2+) transporter pcl1 [Wenzhouxiangella marina]MBB6088002.1 VIT1/CCC1 family predicted Fe2+/Mn2+ transporter [Wenzhouxiangella marina]
MFHEKPHRSHRSGWLRAAVLGANDGIVSTSSLIIGVAAAGPDATAILLAGVAGWIAGAMSMAAGEYVSVSSQADTEAADLAVEAVALEKNHDVELEELAGIYRDRGLNAELAREVARQMMEHDALGAHARDELGLNDVARARPIQAAVSSALTFTVGAALPLAAAWLVPVQWIMPTVAVSSLFFLALLGGLAAVVGGAPPLRAAVRVTFWGALAMLATAAVGRVFGVVA